MAKKSSIEKNNKRIKLTKSLSSKRAKLKAILMDKNTSIDDKIDVMQQMSKLPRNSSRVRVKNRCHLTGRPRGFIRKFGVSRIAFRELASVGLVPGVLKASW